MRHFHRRVSFHHWLAALSLLALIFSVRPALAVSALVLSSDQLEIRENDAVELAIFSYGVRRPGTVFRTTYSGSFSSVTLHGDFSAHNLVRITIVDQPGLQSVVLDGSFPHLQQVVIQDSSRLALVDFRGNPGAFRALQDLTLSHPVQSIRLPVGRAVVPTAGSFHFPMPYAEPDESGRVVVRPENVWGGKVNIIRRARSVSFEGDFSNTLCNRLVIPRGDYRELSIPAVFPNLKSLTIDGSDELQTVGCVLNFSSDP